MKKYILIFSLFTILISSCFAEMRDAAVLTGAYVASDPVNTEHVQQVTVEVYVSGTPEALTCRLVPQWSVDGTNWVSEPVNVSGTASATEQPYTRLDKRFDFSINSSGLVFGETFTRWGAFKWFRVEVMESTGSGSTTALVQIKGATAKFNP